ncbi:hypothetical protein RD110_12290 [Rhodoferax koreense]|uniref:Uncharacterized protein n=1 Tax=Rhodoferax koreensis TaxID=1842727 RepID=A0A1P8JW23_9BURK|nr:hypothetical protein [Rhodoferax koreense]APW37881.1 hypothetical protein RD110_12290 [Rhodoferax koreense]
MRRLLCWTAAALGTALALACLGLVVIGIFLGMAIEPEARIRRPATVSPSQVDHAVRLFVRHDPRRLVPGVRDSLSVQPDDLDAALNYFARRFAATSAQLTIGDGTALLATSTRLPANPLGQAINMELRLVDSPTLPRITQWRIGRLEVPPRIAGWLVDAGLTPLRRVSPGAAKAVDSLDRIGLRPGAIDVAYTWRGNGLGTGGLRWWSAAEQARIDVYLHRLGALAAAHELSGNDRTMPLLALVQPLFQAAAERSPDEAAAVEQNRAALVALAQFVNAREAGALLAVATTPHTPGPTITLNGRDDSAQHFTVSAALTALAGSPLSDAVGLYKELSDAEGGSGFSFNDLAADRAGTRFAESATGPGGARRWQQHFAAGQPAPTLLPPVADLPENMQLAEFNRRFGGVDGAAARRVRAEIEGRLAGLALYR